MPIDTGISRTDRHSTCTRSNTQVILPIPESFHTSRKEEGVKSLHNLSTIDWLTAKKGEKNTKKKHTLFMFNRWSANSLKVFL